MKDMFNYDLEIKTIYVVKSEIDNQNISQEFDDEDEAIQYALENIVDNTYVDMYSVEITEEGEVINDTYEGTIWSYIDHTED